MVTFLCQVCLVSNDEMIKDGWIKTRGYGLFLVYVDVHVGQNIDLICCVISLFSTWNESHIISFCVQGFTV